MSYLACSAQVGECSDGFFKRNARIDSVMLIQVESLQPEPTQTRFACRREILRMSIGDPLIRPGSDKAALWSRLLTRLDRGIERPL